MRKTVIGLAALGIWLAGAEPAGAWHRAGHMAIARLAYQQLDDGQKAQIAFRVLNVMTFGRYVHREKLTVDM